MTREAFKRALAAGLSGLPARDIEERVNFYCEMIDDRMEEGLSEEAAVGELGPLSDIVSEIIAQTPLFYIVKDKVKPKRRLGTWEIVLLVVGAPLWLSLFAAAFAVMLSLYAVLWSLVVCVWAVFASLAACAPASALLGISLACGGHLPAGIAAFGVGLACAGLSLFWLLACNAATSGVLRLTGKIALGIKKCFVRGEGAK